MIPLYIILGSPGSGRREVLADLVSDGIEHPDGAVALFVNENESVVDADDVLQSLDHALTIAWTWDAENQTLETEDWPANTISAFFLSESMVDPVDQLEALRDWIPENGFELARIITVVDCALAANNTAARKWYDACVHFSDVVLLNRREGAGNKWVSDFIKHFQKQHYPTLFDLVKKGRVSNPAVVLFPEARRMSLFFDEDEEGDYIDEIIVVEDEAEIDDSWSAEEVDPYIERIESGHRRQQVPSMHRILQDKR